VNKIALVPAPERPEDAPFLGRKPVQPAFPFPFGYSYRCILCLQLVEHSEEEHDILRSGWAL
jgi:hypothetical protein